MLHVAECSVDLERDKKDQIPVSDEMMGWFGHFLWVVENLDAEFYMFKLIICIPSDAMPVYLLVL